jgi:WD40-like Beta Propeller Repeat
MHIARFSIIVSIALIPALFGCSRQQEKPVTASPPAVNEVATATAVLATIADDEKPPQTTPGHAVAPASQNESVSFQVTFSESGRSVAYLVEKGDKVSVVHNQIRGKEYSAVGTIVLGSDGQRIAYRALAYGKWRMVVDGKEGRHYDVLLSPIFSPDGQHVAYQAKEGKKWYIVVDNTPNAGTTASYTTPEFSSDSTLIAYVESADSSSGMRLIVSDLTFGKQSVKRSIGDLLFTTNRDKTRIAAAQVVDNKIRVIDFSFAKPDVVHEGPLYDVIEKLTFGDDGVSVSYCALKGRTRLLVLDNKEELLPNGLLPQLPVVRPDKKGVGVLLTSQNRFFLHQSFFNSKEKGKKYDEAADLAYSKDARHYVYAARKGENWFVVVNGKEGPAFDRVVLPVFSPDGKWLVYRARKGGKRFLVVADTAGRTIKQHPAYEQVFQPVFTADGKSVVYGVKDGNKLICKVEAI